MLFQQVLAIKTTTIPLHKYVHRVYLHHLRIPISKIMKCCINVSLPDELNQKK